MQSTLTMRKIHDQEINEEDENLTDSEFEQLLDDFTYQLPKRGQIKEGEVKYIDDNAIILDVGLKRDAVVQSSEINQLENEFINKLAIGDEIPVYVQRTPVGDEDLLVSIADALEYQNWKDADKIKEDGDIVELKVIGKNKGGLLVQFNHIEGFVPNSHISGVKRYRNREELIQKKQGLVGEKLSLTPIEVDRESQRLVFSARAAETSIQEQRLEEIKEGEVISGKVVNIVDFGVFVDLGGVDGLVHLSELAWKRIKHPSDVVDIGDEIEVLVLKVDVERHRIQLSRKALLQGPWDRIEETYVPGDLVEVKIVNVVDFGAFAQLPEGIHGLIHVSELGYSPAADALKTVEPGDEVLAKILKIDRNRERISLSMRKVPLEAQYDWTLAKDEASEDNVSQEDVSQEDVSQEDVSQEDVSQEDVSQEDVSNESASVEDADAKKTTEAEIPEPEGMGLSTSQTAAKIPETQADMNDKAEDQKTSTNQMNTHNEVDTGEASQEETPRSDNVEEEEAVIAGKDG